ncbi:hypothetical protein ACFVKB_45140 [Rhodococcus sp. NPDC127530]|uniref:hypothetical protein n=1 Tax=unclassified Rhodococcus (in: high G+C Gram-positive bacteria) TaxID=192944 RepID=UPI0036455DEB
MEAVVAAAVEQGDAIESHALEIKSDVNPTTKPGAAKIARFILGAANRLPADAAGKFEGYAYLMLGVAEGEATGIDMFDTKHLEDRMRRFLDPDSPPRWDVHWLPVDGVDGVDGRGKAVCVISVAPPLEGDPLQVCHGDFQGEGNRSNLLEDGRVYYREKGSTRAARSGEVKALVRRAGRTLPAVDIRIESVGGELRRHVDEEVNQVFDLLFEQHVTELRKGRAGTDEGLDDRLARLRDAAYDEWMDNLDDLAAAAWPGVQFRIENTAGTYLEDIELHLMFPPTAVGVAKAHPDDLSMKQLIPTLYERRDYDANSITNWAANQNWMLPPLPPVSHPSYPLVWGNDDDGLVLTVSGMDLRPDSSWTNDNDDLVIVVNESVESIDVDWQLTAKGHHKSYTGTLTLPVKEASVRDALATTVFRRHTD